MCKSAKIRYLTHGGYIHNVDKARQGIYTWCLGQNKIFENLAILYYVSCRPSGDFPGFLARFMNDHACWAAGVLAGQGPRARLVMAYMLAVMDG